MGAICNIDEDNTARDRMKEIPDEVRAWILHHFGNSLCAIHAGVFNLQDEFGKTDVSERGARILNSTYEAVLHMVKDFEDLRELSKGDANG